MNFVKKLSWRRKSLKVFLGETTTHRRREKEVGDNGKNVCHDKLGWLGSREKIFFRMWKFAVVFFFFFICWLPKNVLIIRRHTHSLCMAETFAFLTHCESLLSVALKISSFFLLRERAQSFLYCLISPHLHIRCLTNVAVKHFHSAHWQERGEEKVCHNISVIVSMSEMCVREIISES